MIDSLLRARLFVARLGESDVMRWWRSDGILGPDGAFVGPRVLPKTHPTGRARIAFAVARHACDERYPDPDAHHLFRLDPETEDRLDALLVEKLGDHEWWSVMMETLEAIGEGADVKAMLLEHDVVKPDDVRAAEKATPGPQERSLPLRAGKNIEQTVTRLTAGFVRSKSGALAVPYVQG